MLAENILLQWRAGADCVAVLDTCAGELGPQAFDRWVVPQLRAVVEEVRRQCPEVRILYYSKGTDAGHWRMLADIRIDGLGVDWKTPLAKVLDEFGAHWAIQGNLDPHALLLPRSGFPAQRGAFLCTDRGPAAGEAPRLDLRAGTWRASRNPENHVRLFMDLQHELFT